MNIEEIKQDLIALCAKHNIIIYADQDEPCTVIEGLLTMEEADAEKTPERFLFTMAAADAVDQY